MDVLYRIPGQMKMFCHGLDGGHVQQIHDEVLQTRGVRTLSMGKVDVFLPVTTASLTLDTLYLGMKNYGGMTNGNRLEVTTHIAIAHYMATFAARTAHFFATLLDI